MQGLSEDTVKIGQLELTTRTCKAGCCYSNGWDFLPYNPFSAFRMEGKSNTLSASC